MEFLQYVPIFDYLSSRNDGMVTQTAHDADDDVMFYICSFEVNLLVVCYSFIGVVVLTNICISSCLGLIIDTELGKGVR